MEAVAAEVGWMNRERRRARGRSPGGGGFQSPFVLNKPEYEEVDNPETAYEAAVEDRNDFAYYYLDNARGQVMALLARDMRYGINTPGEGGGEDQDKARILEYYKYNAFGSVTVLPVYDRDDSIASSVNSSGVFDSGIDDIPGSGSYAQWDLIENTPLTLSDNNTLMTNRRNGDNGHAAVGAGYGREGRFENATLGEGEQALWQIGTRFNPIGRGFYAFGLSGLKDPWAKPKPVKIKGTEDCYKKCAKKAKRGDGSRDNKIYFNCLYDECLPVIAQPRGFYWDDSRQKTFSGDMPADHWEERMAEQCPCIKTIKINLIRCCEDQDSAPTESEINALKGLYMQCCIRIEVTSKKPSKTECDSYRTFASLSKAHPSRAADCEYTMLFKGPKGFEFEQGAIGNADLKEQASAVKCNAAEKGSVGIVMAHEMYHATTRKNDEAAHSSEARNIMKGTLNDENIKFDQAQCSELRKKACGDCENNWQAE